MSAEEQSRELTRSIRREVGKLSEQWNNLIDRSDNWKHRLDEYMTVSQIRDFHLLLFFAIPVTFSFIIWVGLMEIFRGRAICFYNCSLNRILWRSNSNWVCFWQKVGWGGRKCQKLLGWTLWIRNLFRIPHTFLLCPTKCEKYFIQLHFLWPQKFRRSRIHFVLFRFLFFVFLRGGANKCKCVFYDACRWGFSLSQGNNIIYSTTNVSKGGYFWCLTLPLPLRPSSLLIRTVNSMQQCLIA